MFDSAREMLSFVRHALTIDLICLGALHRIVLRLSVWIRQKWASVSHVLMDNLAHTRFTHASIRGWLSDWLKNRTSACRD